MVKNYFSIKVTATLVAKTPLLIASGEQTEIVDGQESRNTILPCTDVEGRYYLPASSLKGACNAFRHKCDSPHELDWIFGRRAQEYQNGVITSQSGAVKFRNAVAIGAVRLATVTRNTINPITGATKHGHLFEVKALDSGAEFQFELAVAKANEQQLSQLMGLLLAWGNGKSGIGRNTRNNQGQFELKDIKISGVDEQTYKTWLSSEPVSNLASQAVNINVTSEPPTLIGKCIKLTIKKIPLSPVFINDGTQNKGKSEEGHFTANAMKTKEGQYVIPASSTRGSYRHLGRKIVLTLLQQKGERGEKTADKWLSQLFGGETHASSLTISDFIANSQETDEQAFIAIDRFTGGVKGGTQSQATAGGNYFVNKPIVDYYLGELLLDTKLIENKTYYPQAAVFLFVLRDLMQGEVLFGGLKGKGFGKLRAEIKLNDQTDWLKDWGAFEKAWNQANLPQFEKLMSALAVQLRSQGCASQAKKTELEEAQK